MKDGGYHASNQQVSTAHKIIDSNFKGDKMAKHSYTPVPFTSVKLNDRFWVPRININRTSTLEHEYDQCKKTGQIDAWDPKSTRNRHIFYDSDLAKWIEAAAYSLANFPDAEVEKRIDHVVDMMADLQMEDGYLNSYFINVDKTQRWKNLRDAHELYCAGHLMEAAVAYYQSTGKRKLLDVMCRYADYIDTTFGAEQGKIRGYCGHEEIELALVKLYHATKNEKYLKLAQYFVDERGAEPHYFDIEAKARGEDPQGFHFRNYEYCQAQVPLRTLNKVSGHAVRAMYIYCGMVDMAIETDDKTLMDACDRLWANLCEKNLYITGGIGQTANNEGFTFDYDLPNETAYAETCANIGLVFWSHRLLQLYCDGKYADVMERALYNGVISGVSLDGKTFFYGNPLESRGGYGRSEWFGCACCPPNIARLLASLGQYVYSVGGSEAMVHLYCQGEAQMTVNGGILTLKQKTEYPWDGRVQITVDPPKDASEFTIKLRIPGWCGKAALRVNDKPVDLEGIVDKGYASIGRTWSAGDVITLELAMPVERVYTHPTVRQNFGYVALQRGPIVYCLEQADHAEDVWRIALPKTSELTTRFEKDVLGGVTLIEGNAMAASTEGWDHKLYGDEPKMTPCKIKAVPYCTWANRGADAMKVWLREV